MTSTVNHKLHTLTNTLTLKRPYPADTDQHRPPDPQQVHTDSLFKSVPPRRPQEKKTLKKPFKYLQ
ncbi:hypothetical protein JOQ06_021749, partial [Pogonophryne albipinna]